MRAQPELNNPVHTNYPHKSIERVLLIKHAQKLGFNLDEIREFMAYWNNKTISH